MKIFFALNHFLPTHIAGIEIYTFNLARSLQAAGADVSVIIPHFDNAEDDHYDYDGIRVIRYAENSVEDRAMMQGKSKPAGLIHFIKILETERPDIVHFQELAQGRGISLYHMEAAAALGFNIFLTCHLSTYSCQTGHLFYKDEVPCDGLIRTTRCSNCTYHVQINSGAAGAVLATTANFFQKIGFNTTRSNSPLGTAFGLPFLIKKKKAGLQRIAAISQKIVVLSHWYAGVLETNGVTADKIYYCAQGLTGDVPEREAKAPGLPLKLVFVGRISRYKGLHLLLEAMKDIPADKLQLDIYGQVRDDDYADIWKKKAEGMDNVNWEGEIPQENVLSMLTAFDLLCLPSTFSEMSPLVIQEAFAAGIPVLASDAYGNAEQISDNENGWLFAFNSVDALKEKLEMLINDPGLIEKAKANIPDTRGFEEVAREHLEMYGGG
jgi:glycosyltransferase involved in cell wall biosynthesis